MTDQELKDLVAGNAVTMKSLQEGTKKMQGT
jgi:hypothetical protein